MKAWLVSGHWSLTNKLPLRLKHKKQGVGISSVVSSLDISKV